MVTRVWLFDDMVFEAIFPRCVEGDGQSREEYPGGERRRSHCLLAVIHVKFQYDCQVIQRNRGNCYLGDDSALGTLGHVLPNLE